jgi:hypothetical protein
MFSPTNDFASYHTYILSKGLFHPSIDDMKTLVNDRRWGTVKQILRQPGVFEINQDDYTFPAWVRENHEAPASVRNMLPFPTRVRLRRVGTGFELVSLLF